MYQGREADTQEVYEIVVRGVLDAAWSSWFDDLALTPLETGDTLMRGPLRDQAALHGLLSKIRDLGVPLLSVQRALHAGAGPVCPRSYGWRPESLRPSGHTWRGEEP